jgi:hypothetical protein
MRAENKHDRLVARVPHALAELLNVRPEQVLSEAESASPQGGGPDLVVCGETAPELTFRVSRTALPAERKPLVVWPG